MAHWTNFISRGVPQTPTQQYGKAQLSLGTTDDFVSKAVPSYYPSAPNPHHHSPNPKLFLPIFHRATIVHDQSGMDQLFLPTLIRRIFTWRIRYQTPPILPLRSPIIYWPTAIQSGLNIPLHPRSGIID